MIGARWPVWRTNPAGIPVSGLMPMVIGAIAVIVLPPILGFAFNLIASGIFGPASPTTYAIQSFGLMLVGSPLLSWAALIVALPLSAYVARKGAAGWGVAILGGVIVGVGVDPILNATPVWTAQTFLTGATGAMLAGIFWLAVRLTYPGAIGVSKTGPEA